MSRGQVCANYGLKGRINSLRIYEPIQMRLVDANSTGLESPPKRVKVIPPRLLSSILIILGAIALFISVVYTSSILAFIGLGLLFFGITFTFVRSDEYVKKILLKTTVSSQQATLKHIINELRYEGQIVYLPPKYFRAPEIHKAYLSEKKDGELPSLEQTQNNEQDFLIEKPPGVMFTPPGAELSRLFETTLGRDFTKVDLQYLRQNMPKLFVEDLEMAQDFEMEVEDDIIRVKIHDSVYTTSDVETKESLRKYSTLDSLLGSAIACTLARTTNKPIMIEKQQTSEDGKDVIIEYRTINDEEQTEQ
jgi:hypothetical protein